MFVEIKVGGGEMMDDYSDLRKYLPSNFLESLEVNQGR